MANFINNIHEQADVSDLSDFATQPSFFHPDYQILSFDGQFSAGILQGSTIPSGLIQADESNEQRYVQQQPFLISSDDSLLIKKKLPFQNSSDNSDQFPKLNQKRSYISISSDSVIEPEIKKKINIEQEVVPREYSICDEEEKIAVIPQPKPVPRVNDDSPRPYWYKIQCLNDERIRNSSQVQYSLLHLLYNEQTARTLIPNRIHARPYLPGNTAFALEFFDGLIARAISQYRPRPDLMTFDQIYDISFTTEIKPIFTFNKKIQVFITVESKQDCKYKGEYTTRINRYHSPFFEIFFNVKTVSLGVQQYSLRHIIFYPNQYENRGQPVGQIITDKLTAHETIYFLKSLFAFVQSHPQGVMCLQ